MLRVLQYVKKYKIFVIIPTIAMFISIALDMISPYLSKVMIDQVILKEQRNLLVPILIALGTITMIRAAFGYVKQYLFDYMSSKVIIDLKTDLFNHIQKLPFRYFDGMNTGELMSRIGEDVENVWKILGFGAALLIEQTIAFILTAGVLFYLDWRLACISLLTMPFILYVGMQLEKKVGEAYGRISDHGAKLNTTAQENIAGVRLVKAFAREKHEMLKFLQLNQTNYALNMEQNNIVGSHLSMIEFLGNVSVILVTALGGILVMEEKLTVGTLFAFSIYIWTLIWAMRIIAWILSLLAQSKASAKKIFEIMDTVPEIQEGKDAVSLKDMEGHIQFENVSFSYGGEEILQHIHLDVKPGSTIAIMGTTGAGKTSLVNLIGRFYDAQEGSIRIDGQNIKNVCLADLRSQMSVVSQDVFLFSDSIENNLKISKEDTLQKEMEEACKDACAYDFIMELEQGFGTVIGERGIGLSGGQKQRISIARALLRKAKILILDDATSALDMETEHQLLKNLSQRVEKPTTLIIAHRISAVKNADEILFLEHGRIVERGTHQELLSKRGRYFEVYAEQFKDFEEMEGQVV